MVTQTEAYQSILQEQPAEVISHLALVLPVRLRILSQEVALDSIGAAGLFNMYAQQLEGTHNPGEQKILLAEVADLFAAFHEMSVQANPLTLLNSIAEIQIEEKAQ